MPFGGKELHRKEFQSSDNYREPQKQSKGAGRDGTESNAEGPKQKESRPLELFQVSPRRDPPQQAFTAFVAAEGMQRQLLLQTGKTARRKKKEKSESSYYEGNSISHHTSNTDDVHGEV